MRHLFIFAQFCAFLSLFQKLFYKFNNFYTNLSTIPYKYLCISRSDAARRKSAPFFSPLGRIPQRTNFRTPTDRSASAKREEKAFSRTRGARAGKNICRTIFPKQSLANNIYQTIFSEQYLPNISRQTRLTQNREKTSRCGCLCDRSSTSPARAGKNPACAPRRVPPTRSPFSPSCRAENCNPTRL